jgi:hypothetical protein
MKKIIYLFVCFIFSILFCSVTCTENTDKCHRTITFINNSSKEVYIYMGNNYPDTLGLHFSNPYNSQPEIYRVKPGEKNTSSIVSRSCFERRIEIGSIFVYVFDGYILATVPWDIVTRDYMVLKTIHPTIEEMQHNNWTIYFTGE